MSSPKTNKLCECGNVATVPRFGGLICTRCDRADAYGQKRHTSGRGRSFAADGYRLASAGLTRRR